ncbi:MAG: gliding motility protein GldL [Prevotellaceae bacterium]|nr:gliding motility protein GldL [Candidatus Colivivens caballi]
MSTSKLNIIARMQHWMDSPKGQTFLNYAYSWGASIVILGALFKLTHITGADIMLFLGMGTEVIVFFLAGFERPFGVQPTTTDDSETDETDDVETSAGTQAGGGTVIVGGGVPAGGTIIIGNGGGAVGGGTVGTGTFGDGAQPAAQSAYAPVAEGGSSVDAAQLAGMMASSSAVASAQFQSMCPEMQEATQKYVDQLNELTDVLKQVAEQSARLTRDSEEMENMNRTLTGINRFYEMQLRSVSVQSSTVDDVNAQTKHLAEQLQELNNVYARMVDALKVNMNTNA